MGLLWSWFGLGTGPSGFSSSSTAEQVTDGIDATHLTAIVTGATSGIGKETARVLALRGATVILPARTLEAGDKVKESLLEANPAAKIDVMEMDLSSLASVESFAGAFLSSDRPLNILINNAGVMCCPFQLSRDGLELQFATNHLGHFLLTNLLLEKMKATAKETGVEGRIVVISSDAHRRADDSWLDLNTINNESKYWALRAYWRSKLSNILHANELSRRLKGAATTCYLALHPGVKDVSGRFFTDSNEATPTRYARDGELAKKLWALSEELVKKPKEPT
ncbi:hypothetical protein Taro_049767 [Colocasia esculenta]|uniref:Short-chain dehydrogenase TIC 32, chloroplastic n=1 Tax=Colocasia esculenta TaxID=4460 RepID=A0A843XBV6_COLES|nr:hypothetical protein [Colocasia esculenta]